MASVKTPSDEAYVLAWKVKSITVWNLNNTEDKTNGVSYRNNAAVNNERVKRSSKPWTLCDRGNMK